MKKIAVILLFVSILFSANRSLAQFQVGISSGVSMAKIKGADFENLDVKYQRGFGIGGLLDIILSDYATLCFQPRYIQKGVLFDTNIPFLGDIDGHATLSYMEIPVAIKFVYTEDWFQPYLLVGPTFGILLSSKFEGLVNDQPIDEEIGEVTGGFDVGLGGGGGIGFELGGRLVFVEGRYIIGYSDILDDGTIVVDGEEQLVIGDVENRSYEFMAGIKIPLGD